MNSYLTKRNLDSLIVSIFAHNFGSSELKIFYDFILVMHINFLNYYKARSLEHLAKFSH